MTAAASDAEYVQTASDGFCLSQLATATKVEKATNVNDCMTQAAAANGRYMAWNEKGQECYHNPNPPIQLSGCRGEVQYKTRCWATKVHVFSLLVGVTCVILFGMYVRTMPPKTDDSDADTVGDKSLLLGVQISLFMFLLSFGVVCLWKKRRFKISGDCPRLDWVMDKWHLCLGGIFAVGLVLLLLF
jgi:hypothetical protein